MPNQPSDQKVGSRHPGDSPGCSGVLFDYRRRAFLLAWLVTVAMWSNVTQPVAEEPYAPARSTRQHTGEIADPEIWPITAVGTITVSQKRLCTGTLIGRDLVLTSAHCLIQGARSVPPQLVFFQAGVNRGVPAFSSQAAHLELSVRFDVNRNQTAEGAKDDWAIVVLKTPINIPPLPVRALTTARVEELSGRGEIAHVGYGQDRPYLPSIVRGCRVTLQGDGTMWTNGCLTNVGYSGSPLIARVDGVPSVIGVNSRTRRGDTREGIACSAGQFITRMTELLQQR